jgi:P27 family predicted phage terminase small subunit
MARHAKTEQAHWLNGTLAHKTTKTASNFVGGRPDYPSHLSKAGRAEFKRGIQILEQRGVLTPGDLPTLCIYAEVFVRWVACKEVLQREGIQVQVQVLDSNGAMHVVTRTNPLLRIVENCERSILALAAKLGLTPSDREKTLQAQPAPQLSAMDRITLGRTKDEEGD